MQESANVFGYADIWNGIYAYTTNMRPGDLQVTQQEDGKCWVGCDHTDVIQAHVAMAYISHHRPYFLEALEHVCLEYLGAASGSKPEGTLLTYYGHYWKFDASLVADLFGLNDQLIPESAVDHVIFNYVTIAMDVAFNVQDYRHDEHVRIMEARRTYREQKQPGAYSSYLMEWDSVVKTTITDRYRALGEQVPRFLQPFANFQLRLDQEPYCVTPKPSTPSLPEEKVISDCHKLLAQYMGPQTVDVTASEEQAHSLVQRVKSLAGSHVLDHRHDLSKLDKLGQRLLQANSKQEAEAKIILFAKVLLSIPPRVLATAMNSHNPATQEMRFTADEIAIVLRQLLDGGVRLIYGDVRRESRDHACMFNALCNITILAKKGGTGHIADQNQAGQIEYSAAQIKAVSYAVLRKYGGSG